MIAGYVLLSWFYNHTDGSVLLAMLFHGATNTIGGAFLHRLYTGADALQLSVWYTAVCCVAALIVVIATKANLGRNPTVLAQTASINHPLATE
jgi:hypothetical protein